MIELKNITKIYKSKKGINTKALNDISLKFNNKGLTFILGKSGSGKSTLLNILGGLDKYTKGDLIVNGKSTKKFKNSEWDAYRNTYMGFVFQEFNLIDSYTVYQNIKLSLELQNIKPTKKEVEDILVKVGLENVLNRKPSELSGGQKQRVAIARALIKNPEIILADEPTGNLDSVTSRQIFDLLKELSKEKLIIVVTHDDESAKRYADRIIEINDGSIVRDTSKRITETENEFKLIKAKLPLKYNIRMGLGNLFHKKIKFIFSVLLISLCLSCLGIMFSATGFDLNKEHINTMLKNKESEVSISNYKNYQDLGDLMKNFFSNNSYRNFMEMSAKKEIDNELFDEITNKTKLKWHKNIVINQNSMPISLSFSNENNQSLYYPSNLNILFVELLKDEELDNLFGNKPQNNDEIVISSYIADIIIKNGLNITNDNKTEIYKPNSYEQLLNDGKYIKFDNLNKKVKIVGIIKYDLKKYEELKSLTKDDFDYIYDDVSIIYNDLLDNEKLYRIFINDDFINNQDLKENNVLYNNTKIIYNDYKSMIDNVRYLIDSIQYYDGSNIIKNNVINDDEIIVNKNILNDITNGDYNKKLGDYINNYFMEDYFSTDDFTKEYIKNNNIIGLSIKYNISNNKIVTNIDNYKEYKIKGVVLDESLLNQAYVSKNSIIDLLPNSVSITKVYTNVSNEKDFNKIFSNYPIDKSYTISETKYSKNLIEISIYAYLINFIGKYGSIFFLIIVIFIIVNLVSNSITYRKKEIGILRALGCKSKDILGMFISEMLLLISISLFISYNIINRVVVSFNNIVSNFIGKNTHFLYYGVMQNIYLIIIIVFIVLVSSFIPIMKLVKTKPIDSIKK